MKGDFSRFTFDPKKNYNSILLQQGRVILDADWNEQGDIQKHIRETEALDVVGRCGAPIDIAGFKVGVAPGCQLILSPGRMYVDGKLCELDEEDQSDIQPIVDDEGPGTYLAYLDVWDRHITAVEDDEIREKALGGPDTATRAKTEWLFKLKQCDLEKISCREASFELKNQIDREDSRLAVRLQPPQKESATDPCEILSGTAYRGLENQLYRVEIHEPGEVGEATFKWSRNNGSIAFAVVDFIEDESEDEGSEIAGTSNEYHKVKLRQLGWDQELRIHKDDWVEVLGDDTELLGLPGTLARVEDIDEADLILTLTADVAKHSNESNPKVRRWDLKESGLEESQLIKGISTATDFEDETDSGNGSWIELEDGIEVSFKAGDLYRTGDFWLIPARNSGEIEWPHEESDFVPKLGIHHHNCLLAILNRDQEGVWNFKKDCRKLFPPLADMVFLSYAGGDGQEGMPGEELPAPLQIRASRGEYPVEGVEVEFEIVKGNGKIQGISGDDYVVGPIIVATDEDGIARCLWKFGEDRPDGDWIWTERVKATLVKPRQEHPPFMLFSASAVPFTLSYVGGDGQEAMPGDWLPAPLQVRASRGERPVEGAEITFEILEGQGVLDPASGSVLTGKDGMAQVNLRFEEELDSPCLRVRAMLIDVVPPDENGDPFHPSIFFNANASVAEEVAYRPPGDCLQLDGVETVRDAINGLCRQVSFSCVGGDGQETMPGNELFGPFRVRVARGSYPVTGAMVQFKIENGKGELRKENGERGEVLDVPTDDDGIATCFCSRLDENAAIEAKLTLSTPTDQSPIRFYANVSVAEEVAYRPPGNCLQLDGVETVRDAIDGLCRQVSFTSVGGDGQEAMPGNELPGPFRVRVARGSYPVKEAMVQFKIEPEKGELRKDNGERGEVLDVPTDNDGIATCFCSRLDENAAIEAKLTLPTPTDQSPIRFYANVSVAEEVAYIPPADCLQLDGVETVRDAINGLCKIIEASRAVWVHGNSLQVEILEGEISVKRENDGTLVELTEGSKGVIHFSIPTTFAAALGESSFTQADEVLLRLKCSDKDFVLSVSIYDGEKPIHDAEVSTQDNWETIHIGPIDVPISTGLGISIQVEGTNEDRQIRFSAAGCQFSAKR